MFQTKIFRMWLIIFLVASPLVFVWHTELIMQQLMNNVPVLFTNGFYTISGWIVYHVMMYFLIFINFATAMVLIEVVSK